ncbi:MAG TPA: HAMP domain-containing sensor histidine kinase [Thermoleophilaceae bacterium]|jgi:two-component system OmpR family sensor kinase
MHSLRARLVASVLVLTALGLLLLGGITYAEQRSFQYDRVDDQARAAVGPVSRALAENGAGPEFGPGGRGPGGPPPGVDFGLPPGTYGEYRDASGNTVGQPVTIAYDENQTVDPAIPADPPVDRPITVDGENGDGHHYRVLATPDPIGGGTTVVAVPLTEAQETLERLLLVEGLVIAGVLLGLAGLAWVVVRVGLLPLDRISHTAGRIAGGDLSHRVSPADPRTEVGRLGIALNGMLDRLEEAFSERQQSEDRLRRFIADASHELRTPLASIRGYAELHRMGAARDPEAVDKAMRRIEDEAARMGILVEDLLTLARLDGEVDVPHTKVDLSALTRDATDDARATAPDREITFSPNGPAVVLGDAHQLRQVLANLLRNALVHTPAGTPVEVSLATTPSLVRVEVRDHGRGIPGTDPNTLFERFWRAEGGRERGKSGAGLGLAIVAGIVAAHGGRVSAANAPDGGAAFVVELPVAPRE